MEFKVGDIIVYDPSEKEIISMGVTSKEKFIRRAGGLCIRIAGYPQDSGTVEIRTDLNPLNLRRFNEHIDRFCLYRLATEEEQEIYWLKILRKS